MSSRCSMSYKARPRTTPTFLHSHKSPYHCCPSLLLNIKSQNDSFTELVEYRRRGPFRAMATTILAARPDLYATPELAPWSNNGGSSINKKIQQLLSKLGKVIPGADQVVKEEVANLSKKKSPVKEKNGTTTPKKRKRMVKEEDESEVDDW